MDVIFVLVLVLIFLICLIHIVFILMMPSKPDQLSLDKQSEKAIADCSLNVIKRFNTGSAVLLFSNSPKELIVAKEDGYDWMEASAVKSWEHLCDTNVSASTTHYHNTNRSRTHIFENEKHYILLKLNDLNMPLVKVDCSNKEVAQELSALLDAYFA